MKWNWKYLIPGYGIYQAIKNASNGYHLGDFSAGLLGFDDGDEGSEVSTVSDNVSSALNDHGLTDEGDIDISSADPTSSAANVINYDPTKSAQENMLGYAQANNSASAYANYLQNAYNTEMSNSAISRAIADAEANGISKYQLFQSGNMAASTPSSGSSMYQSYENAMDRRSSWNVAELKAITQIITATLNSAAKILK